MRLDPARSPASVLLAIATALITLAFALGLWNHGPIPSMETRFAVAVQQMLVHHQWLIPEKNGLPYIEYPPFYYWMALVFAKLGVPVLPAIRLPNLIALWVWIGALYALTRRVLPTLPRWLLPVAVLVAPAALYNFFIAQSDAWLCVGVTLALLGYLRHAEGSGFPRLLWFGTALAVFAKGPLGLVLVALAVGLDLLLAAAAATFPWRELPHRIWRLAPFRGVLLAVAPLAVWYIACGFVAGWDFVRAALVYDNFTRFVAGAGGHANPWWMYAQSFWTDYLPWSVAVPFGLVMAARRLREPGPRLALAWAVTTLVFFSLSASKQSKYILPAAPAFAALALLALGALTRRHPAWLTRTAATWAATILLVFVVLVGAWLPQAGPHIDDDAAYARLRGTVTAAPGRLTMYRWPRSLILWQLHVYGELHHAPMPWFRDARDVYQAVHDGRLRPGDYLLVYDDNLSQPGPYALRPRPAPPYFKQVMTLSSKGGITVFRVMPGAAMAPLPTTPAPPPAPWWSRFDTD
ncbi:MAG: hypothetical protein WCB49_01015 [Gammaproteobacteria bacterium]